MLHNHADITAAGRAGRIARVALAVAIILAAALPGFCLAHYGINPTDEPYQMLNAMDYRNSPLSALTSYLCGLFGEAVGFRWLWFRYLAVALPDIAIVAAGLYAARRSNSPRAVIAATAAAMLFSGLVRPQFNVFGWDCTSTPLVVLTLILLCEYIRRPSALLMAATAVTAALTVMMRLPNIVIIPMAAGLIGAARQRDGARHAAAFTILALLLCLLTATLLYGSPQAFAVSLAANITTQHAIKSLMVLYAVDGSRELILILAFISIVRITEYIAGTTPGRATAIAVGLSASLFIALHFTSDFVNTIYYASSALMAGLLYALATFRRRHMRRSFLVATAVILLSFTIVAGSNLGVRKIICWPVVPFAAAMLLRLAPGRKILTYCLMAGIPLLFQMTIVTFRDGFLDAGVSDAVCRVENGPARGLHTTPERRTLINDIMRIKETAPAGGEIMTLCEGPERFLYEYLTGQRNPLTAHEWTATTLFDDERFIRQVDARIADAEAPVTVVYVHRYGDTASRLRQYLDSTCREMWRNSSFTVYDYSPHGGKN